MRPDSARYNIPEDNRQSGTSLPRRVNAQIFHPSDTGRHIEARAEDLMNNGPTTSDEGCLHSGIATLRHAHM